MVIWTGGGRSAESNKVSLENSLGTTTVEGQIIGGYVSGTGIENNYNNNNSSSNTVSLKNVEVHFYVAGGYVNNIKDNVFVDVDGDVTGNRIDVTGARIGEYVAGGFLAGSGKVESNIVKLTDAIVQSSVTGGFVQQVEDKNNSGDSLENKVYLINTTVNSAGVAGGYNLAENRGSASQNEVNITANSSSTSDFNINAYVVGGLIGTVGNSERIGDTNNNQVTILNSRNEGNIVIDGYVAGGAGQGFGKINSKNNKVFLTAGSEENGALGGGRGSIIITSTVPDSAGYVLGGLVGKNASGDVSENSVTINAINSGRVDVSNYVVGGVNQGIGDAGTNSVSISSSDTSEVNIQKYVLGGLVDASGSGSTYENKVDINGIVKIAGYVAGSVNQGSGKVISSKSTVNINGLQSTGPIVYSIEIGSYVLGGSIEGNGVGSTVENRISIKNAYVKQFIAGGYNKGTGRGISNASKNNVDLEAIKLEEKDTSGNFVLLNHYIAGGMLLSETQNISGEVFENKVSLKNSSFIGQYIAGGVSQGTGTVDSNTVSLVNTYVEGFVAGGLDLQGKNVRLTNNKVSVTGGTILGRVVGARSWSGSDVNFNSVYVNGANINAGGEYKGHVLGGSNQSGGNALNNYVQVRDSTVEGYVAGGFIEHFEGGFYSGSTNNNEVIIENSTVNGNIGGGYNQAGGTLSASDNTVVVKILPTASEESFGAGGFIAGGIIGDKQKGAGFTNNNTVNIINSSTENSFEINSYVAGGYNGGVGEGGASGNTVLIDTPSSPNGSNSLITVGGFVLGGYIGSELIGTTPKGNTNNNSVSVQNTRVATYIAGGYNLGSEGDASENKVYLKNVTLYDGDAIAGHFVVGGLVGEGGSGDATNNTVTVQDSSLKGKFLAGGVNQGSGLVDKNTTILTNTHVQGFVAGGLDWGERGDVTLTNNEVWMNGGSVRVVSGSAGPEESLTGRVVGARSMGAGDVRNNAVHLKNVTIEDGVRGGVSTSKGNVVQNVITIEDSEITGWSNQGGSVAGGYIEAGGNGNTNENSVFIKNSKVAGNIVAGFNQAIGSSDSCNNTVLFEVDSSSTNSSVTAGGFIAGGITGMQSEGVANNNIVTIINTSSVAEINVKGYVAGGYNDGNGKGSSNGNTVILEVASPGSSSLAIENFVIGGYLRTGDGSTNNNIVQVNNAAVRGSSSYVAGGLNEGTGLSENNVVNLDNAVVEGGVLGGRVTGGSAGVVAQNAHDSVSYLQEEVTGSDYIALVRNNVITVSGNTKVYGRVAGGESLVGASDKSGPAIVVANKVFVDSGYIEGDIYGGLAVKANVCDNVINLNGGRIKGAVYGGFSVSGAIVSGNTVNLNGAAGIDLTQAWLFGRRRVTNGTNGNTLNIVNYQGEMQNMGNFDRIDLNLAGLKVSVNSPIILLTEKLPTNLDNSTIHIHSNNLATALTNDPSLADRIEIIRNQSVGLTAYNVKFEKDKIIVTQDRGSLAAIYSVEWDGSIDKAGDSIDLVKLEVFQRPEAGSYIANLDSWAKMHMRLHDRFGQAYYIDPFDGLEKPASGWVRQVGSHSHFGTGLTSKTHSKTAVTQIGADLFRNEINEDWKYTGGVFAGGLYNRANTRSLSSSKSRSDGYSLGIYGTVYTGNSPDDGFYVDSWLLFGRYDNKIWGDTTSSFKYKSHGWVWSVESGYTVPLGESGEKDSNKVIWTFQPEAQFVWDGTKANHIKDAVGTIYSQLGSDNVSIRLGARIHANHMNKGLGFIEGNWIHNTKKAGVRMGSSKTYINGGRDLGEFRMGLEGHLSRNTLGWATVGVQAGRHGYHNETAQIGVRYMF